MADALRALIRGTGPVTWLLYTVVIGLVFGLILPDDNHTLAALLAGSLAAIRIELNDYRARIERMETDLDIDDDR